MGAYDYRKNIEYKGLNRNLGELDKNELMDYIASQINETDEKFEELQEEIVDLSDELKIEKEERESIEDGFKNLEELQIIIEGNIDYLKDCCNGIKPASLKKDILAIIETIYIEKS